jgi:transposase
MRPPELTDEQWAIVAPLIPNPSRRVDWRDTPEVLSRLLWIVVFETAPPYIKERAATNLRVQYLIPD